MFSFFLSKGSGSTGNLKFGGYDLDKYAKKKNDNDIVWSPVIDDGWTIAFAGAKFQNGRKLDIKAE